jgi:hypothetical protein
MFSDSAKSIVDLEKHTEIPNNTRQMIIQRMSSKIITPSINLLLERKCNNTIMADPKSQMPQAKKALPIFTPSF